MNFTPKTEEEVARVVLPAGQYPFTVLFAQEKVSKSGRQMIELKLQVAGSGGEVVQIKDFLLEAMAHKLRHFCYATGLGDTYMNGEITDQFCLNRQGYCEIYVEEEQGQDGRLFKRNRVRDYVIAQPAANAASAGDGPDDEISFH